MNRTKCIFISFFLFFAFYSKADNSSMISYHFVYIDISSTKNLEALHKRLTELQRQLESQIFIIYLSNNKKPIITSKVDEIEQLFNSIYSINPSEPRLFDFEIENILNQFSQNEFIDTIINNEIRLKYEKVYFHFFLDINSFQSRNLVKRFINPILMSNYIFNNTALSNSIIINGYFNSSDLSKLSNEERKKLNEENKKLIINEY